MSAIYVKFEVHILARGRRYAVDAVVD